MTAYRYLLSKAQVDLSNCQGTDRYKSSPLPPPTPLPRTSDSDPGAGTVPQDVDADNDETDALPPTPRPGSRVTGCDSYNMLLTVRYARPIERDVL